MNELKLIPIDKIPDAKRTPSGLYANAVKQFLKREDRFCYIEFEDQVQAKNAAIQFRRNAKSLKLEVIVRQIGERVYLEKIQEVEG